MFYFSLFTESCYRYYSSYQFYKVVDSVIRVLHLANLFFETHKPWELNNNSENQPELDTILHITLETLRICGIILQPIIPDMCETLLNKLQIDSNCRTWQHCVTPSWNDANAISEMRNIQSGKFVLFQRIYKDKKEVVKPEKKDKKEKQKKKITV